MDKSNEFKYVLSSATVELSEHNTYLLLKNEICFYNEPNLNGTGLKYDEHSLERAQTLIDMPVYAKYRKIGGKDDFGGHEARYDSKTKSTHFGTIPIGVHTAVEIMEKPANVNGEEKTVPCLFATMKIWTRNRNAVNAIKRLYEEGRLVTSFESIAYSYHYDNGVKWLDDYEFEGNAMLGSKTVPAYTNAKAELMECASVEDPEMVIAEALAADFLEKGQENMAEETKKTNTVDENENPAVDKPDANEEDTKTSENESGTGSDSGEGTASDAGETSEASETPDEVGKKSEDSEVNADNAVGTEAKCGGDEKKDDETDKSNAALAEATVKIGELTAALAKATARIGELETSVEKLSSIKAEYDKIESERLEQEKAETRSQLTFLVKSSKMFSEEEISDETSEVSQRIKEADTEGVNKLIASRFIESLANKTSETSEKAEEKQAGETSVSRDMSSAGYDDFTGKEFISAFIRAKKKTH